MYIDANKLYGYAMGESLPYDEIKLDKIVKLEDLLKTPNDNEIGHFVEVVLKYPGDIKEEPRNFTFATENEKK